MGNWVKAHSGRWLLFVMMMLSACSDTSSTITTRSIVTEAVVLQLAEPLFRQATETALPTTTITPSPIATLFTGLIPTQATESPATLTTTQDTASEQVNFIAFGQGVEYTIVSGDSLTLIATRYGVTVNDLLTTNGMYRSQVLVPGQVLRVPIPTMTPSPAPTFNANREGARAVSSIATAYANLPPRDVNGVRYNDFLYLSERTQQRIQSIYARGQLMGRNPNAFTRIGDSTIEPPHFFYRFDASNYHLGEYDYLQRTIDYYSGSFEHDSVAVLRGLHTWSVFDSMWSPAVCDSGENMLACEFRLHNPSVIFIRLGSNDAGNNLELTRTYYDDIVRYCIEQGVIPILGTKADRFDGDNSPVNTMIREIADIYNVPLWDFDLVASTLPNRGLGRDDIHLSVFYDHDWRQTRGFTTGHGLHNLTGLIVLDEILQILQAD